jgi:hypothetical protein
VSLQRELTTNTTVEASYVGSFITHVGIPTPTSTSSPPVSWRRARR